MYDGWVKKMIKYEICPQPGTEKKGKAQEYYRQMEQRRMNPFHHIRQVVALPEIYPPKQATRAIEDAFHFKDFSCDYIANLLEQRSR